MMWMRNGLVAGAVAVTAACHGPRAVLSPATTEAGTIGDLWWLFFGICAAVFGVVALLLTGAIVRARRQRSAATPETAMPELTRRGERRLGMVVSVAVATTVLLLFILLLGDFALGRTLQPPVTSDALTVRITGHQWWWYIEYDDPVASNIVQTANELHLPVGRPVQLILKSADVIHSFWLPNLQGKKDLIPGKTTTLWLQPERAGYYRGQCAEFCGYQHAHMGLTAVIESKEEFAKWQEAQRKPAPDPQTDLQRRGREVFLTSACVLCHTISGTPAGSRVGPPLTHLASQRTLAAGTVPNNRGYLAGWILDPQSLKPGARMPQNLLSPDDLQALLDYLEILK